MNYGLNDEQLKTIQAPSPILVHASAGSGKTRCLIAKIQSLLDSGISASSILAVTFTNKAANEMKDRLRPSHEISQMQVSTIHSMCVRIIKRYIHHTPVSMPFSIYDDGDQTTIVRTLLRARDREEDPAEILSIIGLAKSEQTEDQLDEDTFEIYRAYQDILIKNNACDFDDLLIYALRCLQHEDCKNFFTSLWTHVLIDEFQDTSAIQYQIIKNLYDPKITRTLFVIGDANQGIYSWRGAHPENMERFIEEFKPSVHHLTYNYRSSTGIISHANNFLQYGKQMVAKSSGTGNVTLSRFSNHEDEANKIADAIQKMGGYESTAILYRTNARSIFFEKIFAMRKIPYKVVGDLPFYRRRVVKDLLAYCKTAVNPTDMESLVRIVNVPKRGFGESRQEKLMKEGISYLHEEAKKSDSLQDFIKVLDRIKSLPPANAIKTTLDMTGYRTHLENESDLGMLEALLNVASGFSTIDELILASSFLEKDSGRGIKLMTAHASKGLEFERVFVVGVEEGLWPHQLALDVREEERLYFVAISRAKSWLNISYSKSRLFRGVPLEVKPSPLFIKSYSSDCSHD